MNNFKKNRNSGSEFQVYDLVKFSRMDFGMEKRTIRFRNPSNHMSREINKIDEKMQSDITFWF